MKKYTVSEISNMLGKNPETVRRWIRAGKLGAEQPSRKEGNYVTELDLFNFLIDSKKYHKMAEKMARQNRMLAYTAAFAAIDSAKLPKGVNPEDIPAQVLSGLLAETIDEHKKTLKEKRAAAAKLQKEIAEEQRRIGKYSGILGALEADGSAETA